MSLLVVGSVAFDSIETPVASREHVIGGSAVHFSYAAALFAPVKLVGVVGEDWPNEFTQLLSERGVDTRGLEVVEGKKTFYWKGKYLPNMNDRETLDVQLNVFGEFDPVLPEDYRQSRLVFLANGSPHLQLKVLDQVADPQLVVADTMDLWIQQEPEALLRLLQRVQGVVLNDSEAKLLTQEENLIRAGHKILELGPDFVIIKKGEHGAMLFSAEAIYVLPAFPTCDVVDPTGAGDSFAGGMMGFLAEAGKADATTIKSAIAYGTLTASFQVEDFSLERMKSLTRADLDQRFESFREMMRFE
ncbi:MAG: PfkB family carbohydrate kinase [Pirellulaceae bacterium]|nr:PfkB family carbohydrate kinase [Pirellulaceae bacterium]